MAGYQNAKIKLAEVEQERDQLKSEVKRLKGQLAVAGLLTPDKRKRIISRSYDDGIIDELIQWSEEGLFLDECLANWGIDQETWQAWLGEYVELREAVGPARARARAAMLRTLREALKTRSAFPTSLADRIIAMVERENGTQDESASALVRFELCPRCVAADAASADQTTQVHEIASDSAT